MGDFIDLIVGFSLRKIPSLFQERSKMIGDSGGHEYLQSFTNTYTREDKK
jgi:hypothetical protein